MWRSVQLPKISFLVGIIVVETYSPLDNSTKSASKNFDVQFQTKAISTSLSLYDVLKIGLSSFNII